MPALLESRIKTRYELTKPLQKYVRLAEPSLFRWEQHFEATSSRG